MEYILKLIAALTLACVSFVSAQAQPLKYNVTVVSQSGNTESVFVVNDINGLGEIVGYYYNISTYQYRHAFLYSNGEVIDLETLGGENSFAYGINDGGQIVGASEIGIFEHAFLYDGKMIDLGTLVGEYGNSAAVAINNAEQIVGQSITAQETEHAVIFWQEKILDIEPHPKSKQPSTAYSINDKYDVSGLGQIVGQAPYQENYNAFLYTNGSMTDLGAIICPTPWAGFNAASKINNAGQVVGYCTLENGENSAFLYDSVEKNFSFIAGNGSRATGINDNGQVIGLALNGTDSFPFLFMDGTVYNLYHLIVSNLGIIIGLTPTAINNRGQIIANIMPSINNISAILLTPIFEEYKEIGQ